MSSAAETRIIFGIVDPQGKIVSGTGFRTDKVDTGLYTILFLDVFNVVPTVVATQIYPNDINSHGGNTNDNAVIVGITNDRVRIKVGDGGGTAADRYFTFIAMGI